MADPEIKKEDLAQEEKQAKEEDKEVENVTNDVIGQIDAEDKQETEKEEAPEMTKEDLPIALEKEKMQNEEEKEIDDETKEADKEDAGKEQDQTAELVSLEDAAEVMLEVEEADQSGDGSKSGHSEEKKKEETEPEQSEEAAAAPEVKDEAAEPAKEGGDASAIKASLLNDFEARAAAIKEKEEAQTKANKENRARETPKWDKFKEQGIDFSKLEFQSNDTYFTEIYASEIIEKDETFLKVPKSKLLTMEMTYASPSVAFAMQELDGFGTKEGDEVTCFVLYIFDQMKEGKKIDFLDFEADKSSLPLEWGSYEDSKEMEILNKTTLENTIKQEHAKIQTMYELFVKQIQPFAEQNIEQKTFAKVYAICKSQIVSVFDIHCLCPVGSNILTNQSGEGECELFLEDEHFVFKAKEEIKPDQRIFYNFPYWGTHDDFFIKYGSLRPATPIMAQIQFGIDDSSPLYDLKQCLMLASGSSFHKIMICEPNLNSQNLFLMLAFARFCIFDGDGKYIVQHNNMTLKKDFGHYPGFHYGGAGFNGLNIFPHDLDNELNSWRIIAGVAEAKLSTYKTTIVEDGKVLETEMLSHNEALCVEWRRGEKSALKYFINLANNIQRVGEMTKENAEAEIARDPIFKDFPYMRDAILVLISNKEIEKDASK